MFQAHTVPFFLSTAIATVQIFSGGISCKCVSIVCRTKAARSPSALLLFAQRHLALLSWGAQCPGDNSDFAHIHCLGYDAAITVSAENSKHLHKCNLSHIYTFMLLRHGC